MSNLFEPKMEGVEGIEALFTFATEGIMVVNEAGEIIRINPSAERLFGYQKGELISRNFNQLIPHRYAEKHQSHHSNYNSNPHPRSMGMGMELYGLRKDGTEIPVEISLSPYSSEKGKFVIAFIVDITLRKQAEEKLRNYSSELEKQVKNRTLILEEAINELESTKTELREALNKEKELSELKSRFVSMASHEFRTPLATIKSSLSLVTKYGEQNDKVKQDKHVAKIKNSIDNLTDILNDLLSVSKLEEGKIENKPESTNLRSFIDGVVSELSTLAKSKEQIKQEYKGLETVMIDQKLLKHILFNLISNSIKFSPDDKPILIQVEAGNSQTKISVKDNGLGIPLEDQKHLFERFFRGNNVTNIQGTGLGLTIVAKYAELMNGTIDFESIENKGTTFTLRIKN